MKQLTAPGLYPASQLSNAQYHAGPGISKSGLDYISQDPAMYQWRLNAPVDDDKTMTLDIGTAIHTLLLEPHLYDGQFVVAPDVDRRTKEGKAVYAEFVQKTEGKIILTYEEDRKLRIMRESVLAHPAARWLLEAPGQAESSIFWEDEETGELCRVRPDRMLDEPILIDVKTCSELKRFRWSVNEYRYHVQDAMYCDGYKQHYGITPDFVFIVVATSIDCGRYPVGVYELDEFKKDEGWNLYRRDLEIYHQCHSDDSWGGIQKLTFEERG